MKSKLVVELPELVKNQVVLEEVALRILDGFDQSSRVY